MLRLWSTMGVDISGWIIQMQFIVATIWRKSVISGEVHPMTVGSRRLAEILVSWKTLPDTVFWYAPLGVGDMSITRLSVLHADR